ncbi:aldehyde dehydrogenase family protein [Myxococcus sp. SDU36]|uniref:aldehyde dehydrogenase family protein n=1 Tax=Myxococcus sp. SDU36 TaxID=2831967 RepID=UPI0025437AAC|nr:aldehyde dehydrogenase family protein [Myxococcus sp. SDU36]WIG97005.1 aldehyde dehydrogenase family protein [Myxococcus sp. SDU36]
MQVFDRLYIGGEWVAPRGSGHIDVYSASTEEVMGRVPEGAVEDVERAVRAARAAFEPWSSLPVAARVDVLKRLQEGLTARQDELARTMTGEVGMPLGLAKAIQVGTPIAVTGSYVKLLQAHSFEEQVGNSLVVREPVGVVACITPWNYPLHQIVAKVAPALAAGCTVVLKPSEVAPLNAFILADILHAAGVPAGVFNLVSGTGPLVGEALVSHPEVDMVSFTGSTRAGRRVSELAAATVKRVALELGGKSASILLDDVNLKNAVKRGVGNCFLNSGQTCTAHTRLLVPCALHEEAARLAAETAAAFTLGDPFKNEAKLGPVISHAQRARVRQYIEQGIREGARLVAGGPEQPEGLPRGYYVKPTVFADVTPEMVIAQEEIFGPVLAILPYADEDDAVRIANGTIYGLAGGVWSEDVERAKRVARRLRTGQVDINGGRFNPLAPFGGYRQSGNGRELGRYGLEEFQELKAIQL